MAGRTVYSSYRFWVEIAGITEGAFSECAGLQAETEIFEWEEGGLNEYKHRLPGRTKYNNLTLKRGVGSEDIWKWYQKVVTGQKFERQNITVTLYGYAGTPEMIWEAQGALPVKWVGPTFKTGSSEVAVETLELAHHGLKRTK